MFRNPIIKRVAAAFVLLLFIVAVTPKQVFHDLITGHKHIYSNLGDEVGFKTSKASFQCNWNNDVVESPFNGTSAVQIDQPFAFHSVAFIEYTSTFFSSIHYFSSLRGPPASI